MNRPTLRPTAVAWRTRWQRRRPRFLVGVLLAVVLALVTALALVAHFRAPGRAWMLGVSALSPYLMLAAPLALLILLIAREWVGALVTLALTAVVVWTQAPLYIAAAAPPHARELVVMTSNLKLGAASPQAVIDAVRHDHVEVLMLQELTPQEQARLERAGLDRVLPHHIADPRAAALGTGMWSRYPLQSPTRRTDFSWAFVTAYVRVPGVKAPPLLGALHMPGPYPRSALWHHDIQHLRAVLPSLNGAGVTVLGGDFNATPDMHQFRELLTDGWSDGAEQAGAGMTRTWPTDRGPLPVIAIDHVLTRHAVARTASTVSITGSDHRALLTTVAIPGRRGAQ